MSEIDGVSLSDKTSVGMPIRNLIGLIGAVCVGAWGYFGILERLNVVETNQVLMQADLTKNTEFRIKWPRGELGALPADAIAKAAKINAYVGEIETKRYPTPISPMLKASTKPTRCWNMSTKNPLPMLTKPPARRRVAISNAPWMGTSPRLSYIAGRNTWKLLAYMCSRP